MSSNLPPKPDFQVDYAPPRSPSGPRRSSMAYSHSRRTSPPPRDRERDRYPPPRSPPRYSRGPPPRSTDSYVAGSRDREPYHRGRENDRRDDRREREYAPAPPPNPPPRRRDDSWEPGERRDDREPTPPPPRPRRREDDDRRGGPSSFRRDPPSRLAGDTRPWPRRSEPVGRYGRDDRGRYGRDVDIDRRRRPSRSPPPPRRFDRSSSSRARSPPLSSTRRRSASPPYRRRTRSPSPAPRRSPSRTGSPSKLAARIEDAASRDARDKVVHSPSRKRSRERRSRSRSQSASDRKRVARSPTPTTRPQRESSPKLSTGPVTDLRLGRDSEKVTATPPALPARPRSPTPPVPSVVVVEEKRDPSSASRADIPMVIDSPPAKPLPTGPRNAEVRSANHPLPGPSSLPQRPRSPPREPRNFVKTPRSISPQPMSATSATHQPLPEVNATSASPVSWGKAQDSPVTPSVPLPPIDWKIKYDEKDGVVKLAAEEWAHMRRSATHDLEQDYNRYRIQRKNSAIERMHIAKTQRRTMLELSLATLELKFAEDRRKTTSAQMDKARMGALGIDYVHSPS